MIPPNLILLLQIIDSDGSVEPLLQTGLEYSQIAQLVSNARRSGLVVLEEDRLLLTDAGRTLLKPNSKTKSGSKWIVHLDKFRIECIGKDEVYLPNNHPRL